ncbi:hypothetical protein FRC02_006381 [Tulasnella sp. 418]|nr:hypothetical protein FRC02_006381 [Tulasnella sp. 418]
MLFQGCAYSLDLVIQNERIWAIAKTYNDVWNAQRGASRAAVEYYDQEIDHEIAGLEQMGQLITAFTSDSDNRRWIIMHRQPGVPAEKALGWQRYVDSESLDPSDASTDLREPCVKYVERIRSSLEKEVDRMIRKGVIHADLNQGNVLLDEQWDNTDPQNPELVSVTAHVVDWGLWYDIPTTYGRLKADKYWSTESLK